MPLLDNHIYYYERESKIKNDKFFGLLKFQDRSFDHIYIQCTQDDKIYSFMLKSYLSQIDSMYLEKNKMPDSFSNLFDEIQSIFWLFRRKN